MNYTIIYNRNNEKFVEFWKKLKKFTNFSQNYWQGVKNIVRYKGIVSVATIRAISSGGRALDF